MSMPSHCCAQKGREITLIDDVEAELLFARACTPLFDLRWAEFAEEQLDPEVPGLRSPQRFLQSAFRLIRRLGDANVDPALFLSLALTGATEFYANPPNFTDPSLLIATKNTFHDSLDVTRRRSWLGSIVERSTSRRLSPNCTKHTCSSSARRAA